MREDYKDEQKIKQTEEEMIDYFNSRWRDFNTKRVYKIYGFAVNDKNKFTYAGVLAQDRSGKKMVYYPQGYYIRTGLLSLRNRKIRFLPA